ncbi:hypothetical protein BC940DRAFT_302057 [Gongronella butleri]|nr:hypothetical protein BC940DRAFT_302057 [Gongronella butleri]
MRAWLIAISILLAHCACVRGDIRIMATNVTMPSRQATFGPGIDEFGFLGNMHHPMESVYGCDPVETRPSGEWIALVSRGKCSFLTKVRNMQVAGASAVIVGDRQGDEWLTMDTQLDASDIEIPSTFVPRQLFFLLLTTQQNIHRPLLVRLEQEQDGIALPWSFKDCLLVVMAILPSLAYSLAFMYSRHINNKAAIAIEDDNDHETALLWRQKPDEETAVRSQVPKAQMLSTIDRCFPKQGFKPSMAHDCCAICMEDHHPESSHRELACGHCFHDACIDLWLASYRRHCPVCTQPCSLSDNDSCTTKA